MNGIELARRYYEAYGAPLLHEQFPALEGVIAVGLAGSGSECLGYDDEISRDHDFEPGFCLFLPGEEVVDRRAAFLLERAYAKLPGEFEGFHRQPLSPVGGNRHGVIRMSDFFEQKTGCPDGRLSLDDWLRLPEYALLEAVNGAVFRDDAGDFTRIRAALSYLPEEVRRKKLAGRLLLMAQAGEYNFPRCLARGETGAARLAVVEYVASAMHAAFLAEKRYLPYYKWQFRALRETPRLSGLAGAMEALLSGGDAEETRARMDEVTDALLNALREEGLPVEREPLERAARRVNDAIADPTLRNRHILCAV